MAESYGGALDFLKEIIPSHTIVGSALRGDVKGATTRAVKFVNGATATPSADQLAIMQAGATPQGGGMFGGLPSWVIPVAGIGFAAILFMSLGKRRR